MNAASLAVVTPSLARDFELCRELNESVLTFLPASTRHYIVVDACDLDLFRALADSRTIVAAVEDVLPKGYRKLRFARPWWFSAPAMFPLKGWLVQQLVKLCAPGFAFERILVNVDSDVRFIRRVDSGLFVRGERTRLYRLRGGVTEGMHHVTWHRNVCRLLGVEPDPLPMDDYVGNVISWDRDVVLAALRHIERTTGQPWHVALARTRRVSEYLAYGLYVDKVIGAESARVWTDERSWCHTYWRNEPLPPSEVDAFTRSMRDDDVAFSIAGYSGTPPEVRRAATRLALRLAATGRAVSTATRG